MKQLSLLFVLICLLASASRAATVSGTLSYPGSIGPAAGKKIYLADSSLSTGITRLDSAITNSTGGYSLTVPSAYTSGRLIVYSMACGYPSQSAGTLYSGSNLTINLTLGCSFGTISGSVYYSGSTPASGVKVYVVDSATSGAILHRDSTFTNASGAYSFTIPSAITSGRIRTYVNACGATSSAGWYTYTGLSMSGLNLSIYCPPVTVIDSVVNSTTGLPVAGQKVYFLDSSATVYFKDSAITDISGRAFFYVPYYLPAGTAKVYTYACGWQSQTFSYTGSSMTAPTLSVCLSTVIISGTLTNATTSAAVSYWPVTLVDSSGGSIIHYDSTTTNSSGAFAFIIPASITSGRMVVSAFGCGNKVSNGSAFSGSNLTLNLAICATSTATIGGTLINGVTSLPMSGQKVYFLDSLSPTVVFRDSAVTNTSGNYVFTIPPATATGPLKLSTLSCGSLASQYYYYYGSSITVPNWTVTSASYTFTGTVYYRNKVPAAGVNVFAMQYGSPSLPVVNSAGANAVTAANGTYTLTIPCSWTPGYMSLEFGNTTCLSGWYGGIPFTGASASGRVDTFNCPEISGVVSKQGGGVAANAKVYLIKVQTDTTTVPSTIILTATDSTTTNASGQYQFNALSWNGSAPHGYSATLVKAALQPSDPAYSSFLPTYHDSALVWSGADTVTYMQWLYLASNIDISLRGGTNTGGPGFIGGSVLLGANKSAGVGDPLASRILLLTTATGQAVAYTYSDAAGQFSFSNLPLGNYLLFGDAGGKANPALAVSLTAGSTSVNNIVFEENSTRFEGHFGDLSVSYPGGLAAVSVFPNPAKDQVSLNGLAQIKGDKTIILRNINGQVMSAGNVAAGKAATLSLKQLPAGIYMLQLRTEEGTANFRLIKE